MKLSSSDKIAFNQKVAFGLGMAVPIAFVNSVAQLTNLIYNLEFGVSVIWLGVAMMIPRLWDAITDPLAGYISDNTRTRWGRRRPYVFLGSFAVAITYVMIWWVPVDWSPPMLFAYYLGISLLFYTCVTIFSVPLVAMGYEMTEDYHEKTRLFAYGSFIGNIMAIATPWMYKVANLDIFSSPTEGIRYVALGVGVIILVTTILPGIFCKERNQDQVTRQPRIRFWKSMKEIGRDKVFIRLVLVVVLVTAGFNFVNNFSNYIVLFYVYGGDKDAGSTMLGWNGSAWAITALIAVFPMTLCSEKFGKAKTVQLFVILMMASSLSKIYCYNPEYPWLMLIPTMLLSAGMLALYTMAGSMVADICNQDELKHGVRREGSYSAVYSWWLKVAVSVGFLVSGLLLKSTGFNEAIVEQSSMTLFMMRFWEISLTAVVCLVAVYLLRNYPLTEKRAYEIKAALDEQRANQ